MLESAALALLLAASQKTEVSWSDLRADLEQTICVVVHELPGGRTSFSLVPGSRKDCSDGTGGGAVSRAVDAALDDARVLVSATGAGDVGFSYEAERPIEQNNRELREAYLASDRFLRPILRRLPEALAAEGLTCPDCPAAEAPEPHHTTWERFAPYLTAYFWPDRVRTPTDADGNPSGEPEYGFHICAGINGVAEIAQPDPRLVDAGLVVAMATEELRQIAFDQFRGLLNEPEFAELTDDESRTAYLRRQLGARLAADDRLAPSVCGTLRRFGPDLGLTVESCPPEGE